jgi:DNA-binding transcriptional LysR family regulator
VFQRDGETLPVRVDARLMTSDAPTLLGACLGGCGIAQVLEFATRDQIRDGRLVEIFPDWPDERFPLYALYPSRQHRAAKVAPAGSRAITGEFLIGEHLPSFGRVG